MNLSTVDKLAIAAVLTSGILFIIDSMPKLTALIYSMVI
jgi:hypothetical protein